MRDWGMSAGDKWCGAKMQQGRGKGGGSDGNLTGEAFPEEVICEQPGGGK